MPVEGWTGRAWLSIKLLVNTTFEVCSAPVQRRQGRGHASDLPAQIIFAVSR